MAIRSAESTITVSLTMPQRMVQAIEQEARRTLRSKSDVIRTALMNSFSAEERAAILNDESSEYLSSRKAEPVSYRTPKKRVSSKPLSDAAVLAKKLSGA